MQNHKPLKTLKKAIKTAISREGIASSTRKGNKELDLLLRSLAKQSLTGEKATAAATRIAETIARICRERGKEHLDRGVVRSLALDKGFMSLFSETIASIPVTVAKTESIAPTARKVAEKPVTVTEEIREEVIEPLTEEIDGTPVTELTEESDEIEEETAAEVTEEIDEDDEEIEEIDGIEEETAAEFTEESDEIGEETEEGETAAELTEEIDEEPEEKPLAVVGEKTIADKSPLPASQPVSARTK